MPVRRPACCAVLLAAVLTLAFASPAAAAGATAAGTWEAPGPPAAESAAIGSPDTGAPDTARLDRYRRLLDFPNLVRGGTVTPHWLPDGSGFWYRTEDPRGEPLVYRVDPTTGAKERLAAEPEDPAAGAGPRVIREALFPGVPPVREVPSPDGRSFLTERDHDLWLRIPAPGADGGGAGPEGTDGDTLRRLTGDGTADFDWKVAQDDLWMHALWSPDGDRVLVIKEDRRGVDREPLVDWLQRTPTVSWLPLPKAGRPLARTELWVIDAKTGERVRVDLEPGDVYQAPVAWLAGRPGTSDGGGRDPEILLLTAERNFSAVRLRAADPRTGAVRTVIEERSDTFIKNLCLNPEWTELATVVPAGAGPARIVWQSERDGWDHLYLYDLEGNLLRRLTAPKDAARPWPVLRVVGVEPAVDPGAGDREAGWVYFTAHAEPGRPYDTHLYRVRLDNHGGRGLARLTDGAGMHDITLSPSRQVFLDTWSGLDRTPRTALRRADGTLLAVLEEANVSALGPLGLRPPEPFTVKANDGTTDLYGVLYLPADFDPRLRYPVVEDLYAGPFRVHHQRRFTTGSLLRGTYAQALAQLGFVVVTLDGPGTPERGKAFQDVVWRRFGQTEIPEHAAAIRRLAADRPWMDLSRVGAFGGSWGGYMTVRALLTAPDLYTVGVAANPVYDFVDHGATGLEGYMDLPENNPEGYAAGSNLTLADRLQGHLLLMHGTADANATFSATMKMVDALARAGKPYDLIILPGQTHHYQGYALDYRREATRRYLQEHLGGPEERPNE